MGGGMGNGVRIPCLLFISAQSPKQFKFEYEVDLEDNPIHPYYLISSRYIDNRKKNTVQIQIRNLWAKAEKSVVVVAMSGMRKSSSSVLRQSSYSCLYENPLNQVVKHSRNVSDGDLPKRTTLAHHLLLVSSSSDNNKENVTPTTNDSIAARNKGNVPVLGDQNTAAAKSLGDNNNKESPSPSPSRLLLKSSSLQQCMQFNPPDSNNNLWDHSDSEAAPAASWSTLPNRYLLCRPLPIDIGRCTCVIVKETSLDTGSFYALYTNEGHGRQDRKLAVARHRRRNGRSQYTVAQSAKGLSSSSDESILGTMTSNFMGSKYHIWDQGSTIDPLKKQPKILLAVVGFVPTVITCTGSYRSLRAWIPKHQSMQLKSTSKIQHINGLPKDWEEKTSRSQQLFSRVPHYNNFSSQYELDFRQRGRAATRIQSSVKNFQLTMEENGRQSVLQLGRVGKTKYVMDYRYPLTGYQAFCICLASMDSKLCCTV